mgnify:CR=1 FL=1
MFAQFSDRVVDVGYPRRRRSAGGLAVGAGLAVAIVVLAIWSYGKLRQPSLQYKIETDIEAFALGISINSASNDYYTQECLLPAFKRGISVLSERPRRSFKVPVPLLAAIIVDQEGNAVLSLLWLEEGFATIGVVVEDDRGTIARFVARDTAIEPYGERERRLLRGSLRRGSTIPIVSMEGGSTTRPESPDIEAASRIELPRSALSGPLRVRLFASGGPDSEALAACVVHK